MTSLAPLYPSLSCERRLLQFAALAYLKSPLWSFHTIASTFVNQLSCMLNNRSRQAFDIITSSQGVNSPRNLTFLSQNNLSITRDTGPKTASAAQIASSKGVGVQALSTPPNTAAIASIVVAHHIVIAGLALATKHLTSDSGCATLETRDFPAKIETSTRARGYAQLVAWRPP